jgi:hypothetical protein
MKCPVGGGGEDRVVFTGIAILEHLKADIVERKVYKSHKWKFTTKHTERKKCHIIFGVLMLFLL